MGIQHIDDLREIGKRPGQAVDLVNDNAAGDVTLRRDAVFDWALPFLGAAVIVFRDFMETVDIVWAPLVRGAGLDARTTQSPAHREARPKCFTGWPCPPAGTHSNASIAAEVQSVLALNAS